MKLSPFGKAAAILLAVGALAAVPACQPVGGDRADGPLSASQKARARKAVDALLAEHRGKVLLLLLGREGCPGTEVATPLLDAYAQRKPADVAILRLDVTPPEGKLQVTAWNHSFPRRLDRDLLLAEGLEFFFYPTFYVFDRGGELRFTGGYDAQKTETMVKEILAEVPGQPKKMYTVPLPAIGTLAPPLAGKTLTGQDATLLSLRGERGTLLFFGRTSCTYSTDALPTVKWLADAKREKGIAVALINYGEDKEGIQPIYEKAVPGLPVVWDPTGAICKSYGVDTVPFFFLLNRDGAIAQRRPFTGPVATGAINVLLGIAAKGTSGITSATITSPAIQSPTIQVGAINPLLGIAGEATSYKPTEAG